MYIAQSVIKVSRVSVPVTPHLVLEWWQDAHGPLTESLEERFLNREELKELCDFPAEIVEDAIRNNKKLIDALDVARTETAQKILAMRHLLATIREVTETHKSMTKTLLAYKEKVALEQRRQQSEPPQMAIPERDGRYLRPGRCEWCDAVLSVHDVHECFR